MKDLICLIVFISFLLLISNVVTRVTFSDAFLDGIARERIVDIEYGIIPEYYNK